MQPQTNHVEQVMKTVEALSLDDLEKAIKARKDAARLKQKLEGVKVRRELEKHCQDKYGMKLSDIFTATDRPLRQYKNPETGETYSSKGKKPAWLKGKEKDYLVTN